MAQFEKHIALSGGSNPSGGNITTTSATYVEQSAPRYRRIDTDQYSDAAYYYEAVIKTSAAAGYSALYTTGGSEVTDSEVSTTSTSYVRLRSSAINPTTGDYTDRLKNDGTNTTTKKNARVVIVQDASTITNTETQHEFVSYVPGFTTTSGSYVDLSNSAQGRFLYTSANWDGTVAIFYEATFKTSGGTANSQLATTAGSAVTDSQVTTTSTSYVRVRSIAISLVDGTEYKPQFNAGSGTTTITGSQVIIQQSDEPTKTESHMQVRQGNAETSSTSYVDDDFILYFDPANWVADTKTFYHEASIYQTATSGQADLFADDDASAITNSEVSTSTGSAIVRVRSSALTMPVSAQNISARVKVTGMGTLNNGLDFLIAVLVWTNTPPVTGMGYYGPYGYF